MSSRAWDAVDGQDLTDPQAPGPATPTAGCSDTSPLTKRKARLDHPTPGTCPFARHPGADRMLRGRTQSPTEKSTFSDTLFAKSDTSKGTKSDTSLWSFSDT